MTFVSYSLLFVGFRAQALSTTIHLSTAHNLDVDEIFDDFRLQSNKHAFLRKAGPSVVMALLAKAAEMLEEESQRGQMELEMELAVSVR